MSLTPLDSGTAFSASRRTRGATLTEVLVASAIGAVLVAGLMATFLTALRISSHGQGNVEAASLAQQTLERFRNHIACDDSPLAGGWFDPTTCAAVALPTNEPYALPAGTKLLNGAREYTVTAADCDGDDTAGDCFKVVTKLTWDPPQ
ncbi:MAG: hypothetical protein A3C53_06335 [Omnitrophica WOR_2 bacterium RIFCSPHIGHO2_02_FULL_68_15]|nr:MAG: hypothetical protein A3C53_06335 [Omnitrophica WOR_2 bacterium RIFCSPHIGHO2_02_FULL_68_15]